MKQVDVALELRKILLDYLSLSTAEGLVRVCKAHVGGRPLAAEDVGYCAERTLKSLRLYGVEVWRIQECVARVRALAARAGTSVVSTLPPASAAHVVIVIKEEADIVAARSAGRDLCRRLGFSHLLQIKVATVISELSRNILQYAGTGTVELAYVEAGQLRGIEVIAADQGPGIASLEEVLKRGYHSRTGMGLGLAGSRRLMDEFEVKSEPGRGTEVRARKFLG